MFTVWLIMSTPALHHAIRCTCLHLNIPPRAIPTYLPPCRRLRHAPPFPTYLPPCRRLRHAPLFPRISPLVGVFVTLPLFPRISPLVGVFVTLPFSHVSPPLSASSLRSPFPTYLPLVGVFVTLPFSHVSPPLSAYSPRSSSCLIIPNKYANPQKPSYLLNHITTATILFIDFFKAFDSIH